MSATAESSVQVKRGYVDTPHGQVHYRTAGEGEPLMIFHQTPASSRELVPLITRMAERGFKVIGMDTMGYGESDRPPHPYTTMTEFARSVTWAIDGLGLGKTHLLGVLTGAQIALQVAGDFPDYVKSVVVQEAFNWGTPSRRAAHERIHRYHEEREDGSHLIELWDRTKGLARDMQERAARLREFLYVNDKSGAEVYEHMGWEGAGPYAMCREVIWDVTPKIQAPVLVTYFKDSERNRALERFLETIPRSKGDRDAPLFLRDPDGFCDMAAAFMREPGI